MSLGVQTPGVIYIDGSPDALLSALVKEKAMGLEGNL